MEDQIEIICRFTSDGTITFVNEMFCRMFGKKRDELVGANLYMQVITEDVNTVQEKLAELSPKKPIVIIENRVYTENKGARYMQFVNRALFDTEERIYEIQAVGRDITEQRLAENALRMSEQTQKMILEAMVEGVVFQGADGSILNNNKSAERILGLGHDQLLGRNSADPRWCGVHEDGSYFPSDEHPTIVSLRTGMGCRNVVMGVNLPDGSRRWISINSEPLFKPNAAHPYAVIATFSDITERKQTEERLRQSQKMEAIGHLAGGMAHEFNNILAAMLINLDLAKIESGESERQLLLTDLEDSCKRAASLVRGLLAFSRKSVMKLQVLDLAEVVKGQARTLRLLLGEQIEWQLLIPDSLPCVKADKSFMEQVLMNLCLNARDAMKQGGQIRVGLNLEKVEPDRTKVCTDARAGQHLQLSVSDTGCGMDECTLKRLFEPFFTTKGVGQGTGLGLAFVRGIVHQHQGWVEVDSSPGKGTTFRVYLPIVETTEPTIPAFSSVKTIEFSGGCTILIVEDNEGLRKLTKRVFIQRGCRVLEAQDGESAIALWAEHCGEIDLLYTDMVMPGLFSGLQVAKRFLAEKPDLKVILTSGYNTNIVDIENTKDDSIMYLPKPCPIELLMDAISRCLRS